MWYETLPEGRSWAALWSGWIRCGCGGIRTFEAPCASCGTLVPTTHWVTVLCEDGREEKLPAAYMGGEARYEDWVYLLMLQREWLRPITDADRFLDISETSRPSARAIVVLTFWTYFETRIERVCREPARKLQSEAEVNRLLRKHWSVGSRLNQLYRTLYSTTYAADLEDLGFAETAALLEKVQRRRNDFTHGHPEAIDDPLVEELVRGLKAEHEGWIAVFNKRMKEARERN